MNKIKILLVDDDIFILKTIGPALEAQGYDVAVAQSGEEAVRELQSNNPDVVITDLVMGEVDGISVLKSAKENDPDVMVIILTGFGDLPSAIDAIRLDADDYLLKPCEPDELFFRVKRCIEKIDMKRKISLFETMLPVCWRCKKIKSDSPERPEDKKWISIEEYITEKTRLEVTSGYCPECIKKLKKELDI